MSKVQGYVTLVLFLVVTGGVFAQNTRVTLTSLEWPPYTSESLKNQGALSEVAVAAFKAMGYELSIKFVPWERAVDMAKGDPSISGYFPEYYSKDTEAEFIYSSPMGTGPLGFVEKKAFPVKWSTLNDLKGLTIGVVNGYINTAEFDSMVVSKSLKVDGAVDDATNVVKVANGRIPLAVIDSNVLEYLLNKNRATIPYHDVVQFNAKTLDKKSLYVCFKKGAAGQKLAEIFNAGILKINVDKITRDYFGTLQQ